MLREKEFVFFDTETTGLDPGGGDRVIEIAAVKVKDGRRIATFESLVNPGRSVSEGAFLVNRISEEMLKDAPTSERVMPAFLDFIKNCLLCSYNAAFDIAFLHQECALTGRSLWADAIIIDILRMARILLPGLERYALWFVAAHLGIKQEQSHRALADVELMIRVYHELQQTMLDRKIDTTDAFISLFGLPGLGAQEGLDSKKAYIQQALLRGAKLKITYLSSSTLRLSERLVLPKEIKTEKTRGYLIAHCYSKNEDRTFRLDGILDMQIV